VLQKPFPEPLTGNFWPLPTTIGLTGNKLGVVILPGSEVM